jgi:predicted RNase H-like HicB family nuclease
MPQVSNRVAGYWKETYGCEPDEGGSEWHPVEPLPLSPGDEAVASVPSAQAVASFMSDVRIIHAKSLHGAMARLLEGLEFRSARESSPSFTSVIVPIISLAPEPFHIDTPISVVVQGTDGDYTATFFDANIGSSGETQQEAVDNLKELLIMSFESLADDQEESLGPLMKRQKLVLEAFMRRA